MKKKLLYLTWSALCLSTAVFAQDAPDPAATQKIREEGLNHSKIMETALLLTDFSGPRLTGSPGLKKAQQLVADQLKADGFQNVKIEPWGKFGKGWQIDKNYVALTAPYYDAMIAYPKAWSGSTNGLIKGEVVLVKADSVKDLEKYKGKLAGKIVIMDAPNTQAAGNIFTADGTRNTDETLARLAAAQPQAAGAGRSSRSRPTVLVVPKRRSKAFLSAWSTSPMPARTPRSARLVTP